MSEATAEQTRGRRKTMIGTVVSVKMDKTAVVAVVRRYPHPLYHKIVRRTKRYKVHDPNNSAVLGDYVRIIETRPISKEKRWRILETMVRGNVAELQPRDIAVPEEAMPARPTPSVADAAGESPMSTDSTVMRAASDDMDPSDYSSPPGAPMLDENEPAGTAANVTPDLTVEEREGPAASAADASRDEAPMSSDSDVLAAAADDMDKSDYEEEKQA